MGERGEIEGFQLLLRVTQHPLKRGIGLDNGPVGIHYRHSDRCLVKDLAETLLALPKPYFSALPGCNIYRNAANIERSRPMLDGELKREPVARDVVRSRQFLHYLRRTESA